MNMLKSGKLFVFLERLPDVKHFKYLELTYFMELDRAYSRNLLGAIMRSSRPEVFFKKGVFRNFIKFTGVFL